MNKQEFLAALRKKLSGIPQDELEERLSFYSEMIDDRTEDGIAESAAVKELGSVDEIVSQITAEIPLSKLVKERVKPKRKFKAWEIIFLVLGSPVWLSVLIAVLAAVIAAFAALWSLVVSVWAAELALAICPLAAIVFIAVLVSQGNTVAAAAMLGAGLICLGIVILGFFACKKATAFIAILSEKVFIGIKSFFIKKGDAK